MTKNKSIYVSLHNDNLPDKIMVNGNEIILNEYSYFAMEVKGGRIHYVLGSGMDASNIPFLKDTVLQ